MWNIWPATLRILNDASIYLLVGFTLAGVLHVVLNRFPGLMTPLTGKGTRPVFLAAAIGLPMPLCSCGVLPAALTLRRKGASKGATASFLVSVPETDIVSILITLALLGPALAVFRPVAALFTAVATGLLMNRFDRGPKPVESEPNRTAAGGDAASRCEKDGCAEAAGDDVKSKRGTVRGHLTEALRFGFVEVFDDVIGQLLIGILIAGAIATWLPADRMGAFTANPVATYLIMLAAGVPVYVCATASTPIVAALIVGGLSPGAGMVFLLAGPATNIASLLVLKKHFGRWATTSYVASISVLSVMAGVGLDGILGADFELPAAGRKLLHAPDSAVNAAATVILLGLAAVALWRKGSRAARNTLAGS